MSRLLCLCDNGMENSTVPSDSIAEIYTTKAIAEAIGSKMELMDLCDEKYEYWYCQSCKRITVILRATGKYLASYSRVEGKDVPTSETLETWRELYFWRDREFYDATEAEWKITVEDFEKKHPSRYLIRLSPDEKTAYVFDHKTMEYLFAYIQDPMPEFVHG